MKRLVATFAFAAGLLAMASTTAVGQDGQMNVEDLVTGRERPQQIPLDWIGSATKSAPGWRWDDPNNPGNSVRIFRGNPDDPDPSKRDSFVVVVHNGVAVGRDGQPMTGYIPEE